MRRSADHQIEVVTQRFSRPAVDQVQSGLWRRRFLTKIMGIVHSDEPKPTVTSSHASAQDNAEIWRRGAVEKQR